VLSGFLITALLLEEWSDHNAISLRRFYARRMLRLLPALAVFVVVYVVYGIAFESDPHLGRNEVTTVLGSIAAAGAYVLNWYIMWDAAEHLREFRHLWSLSVEEQYYLIWPGVLVLLLLSGASLRMVAAVTAALIAVSAALPFLITSWTWERLYFGTDFRMHGLLAGSLTGVLFATGPALSERWRTRLLSPLVAGAFTILLLATLGRRASGPRDAAWRFAARDPRVLRCRLRCGLDARWCARSRA
jgi:peptidoglycan/LPS O-acetylase OafA/YrhL